MTAVASTLAERNPTNRKSQTGCRRDGCIDGFIGVQSSNVRVINWTLWVSTRGEYASRQCLVKSEMFTTGMRSHSKRFRNPKSRKTPHCLLTDSDDAIEKPNQSAP